MVVLKDKKRRALAVCDAVDVVVVEEKRREKRNVLEVCNVVCDVVDMIGG